MARSRSRWAMGALLCVTAGMAACSPTVLGVGAGQGGSSSDGGPCTTGACVTSSPSAASNSGCTMTTPTYAGRTATTYGALWVYQAQTGLAAGDHACADIGADHVCDYDDIRLAASKGEITDLATTDTAWLQRTHPVTVAAGLDIEVLGMAVPNAMEPPGAVLQVTKQSRGDDWNYAGDYVFDCEFVSFEKGLDAPTYHLDDNPCACQTKPGEAPGDLACGGNHLLRNVLCCFPKKCPAPAPDDCTCDPTKAPSVCE